MQDALRSNNKAGKYINIEPVLVFDRSTATSQDGMVHQRFADGSEYHGEMVKSKFHGRGCYVFANGDTYFGEFSDDQINGSGVIFYTRFSDRYEGEFKNGKRHGVGVYFRGNNETYEGEFDQNFREGIGQYTFRNGDVYKGEYKLGLEQGHSVYTTTSGEQENGEWVRGVQRTSGWGKVKSGRTYEKVLRRVDDVVVRAHAAADKAVEIAAQAEDLNASYRSNHN